MLTVNLRRKIHRKQWEPVYTPLPVTTAAGTIFGNYPLPIPLGDANQAYYFTGVSSCYQYAANEEAFGLLPNSGSAGTFNSGAALYCHPMGPTGTASAGSTTTLTSTATINRDLRGYRIRITAGTNKGQERIIASNTWGANAVITVQDAFGSAIDNTSQYVLLTGRVWFYVPGGTSGFNYYDWALNAWTSRSIASGPAITSNEGCLIGTPAAECPTELSIALGTQAAGTVVDTSRNWAVNVWARHLVKIVSGTGVGQYRYVVSNTPTTLTVDTNWGTTPDLTSVYEITGHWSDAASAGSTTTLTAGTGTPWTASQWIGYQVRAVAGTGAGQVAVITANTTSQLTFAAVGTGFDNTTRYVIENNDNALFFLGGAAVTLFQYSISGNSWSTVAPGAARSTLPSGGASGNFIGSVLDALWMGAGTPAAQKQNGRYIYSFRGGASGALDIYDIAGNTWISTWTYGGATNETFGQGTSWCDLDGYIYGQKDATGRFFRFDVLKNELIPLSTNNYTQGAATNGSRMLIDKYFDPVSGKSLKFLYWQLNSSTQMARMMEVVNLPTAPLWTGVNP